MFRLTSQYISKAYYMSDKNLPSQTDFVTNADLSAKRPPPGRRGFSANPFLKQLTQASFWGFVYFTFVLLFGSGIVKGIFGAEAHNAILATAYGLLVGA